jgi:hypothetical protein
VDPEAVKSTDDGDDGIPDYVYPCIAIGVLIFICVPVMIIIYNRNQRRVGAGDGKELIKKRTTRDVLKEINTASTKEEVKKPKIRRKETKYHPEPNPPGSNATIINVNEESPHPPPGYTDKDNVPPFLRTGDKIPEKNVAPASTGTDDTRPDQDIPPILNGTGTKMPTQNTAPASTDTVDQQLEHDTPPALNGTGTQMHDPNIAPVSDPCVPDLSLYTGPGIPPAFPYKTPAEARELGLHV